MGQLYWHKPRPATLGPNIEALADDHREALRAIDVFENPGPRMMQRLLDGFSSISMPAELDNLVDGSDDDSKLLTAMLFVVH